jgi:hypothetical protein
MYIIIKDRNKIKGKSITEFQSNLVKEGYPAEVDKPTLEKMRFMENKYGKNVFKRSKR